jgi:hypothetical protein
MRGHQSPSTTTSLPALIALAARRSETKAIPSPSVALHAAGAAGVSRTRSLLQVGDVMAEAQLEIPRLSDSTRT